ncbi:RNA-dependent RNA polymerase [Fusarium asiaticum negative-stranded RNA virus 1]|uniref:RNA-directed RNA polymerase n=1 Tax=Fusarium asiaticum negative-stranded RNA virus 1 TaxID=2921215 RepID=A0AA46RHV5_9MONO|nr:RNA-dependent RNA polymerase [Fusarium asiaticum negative-stranded RNA virus 1]UNG44331.1 RNA-dependent RNA polymerase [Fusarium asiaticum negative-stranded RNA virus 1]
MDFSELFDPGDEGPVRSSAAAEKHLRSPILASLLNRIRKFAEEVMIEQEKDLGGARVKYIPREVSHLVSRVARKSTEFSYSSLPRLVEPWLKDLPLVSEVPKIVTPDFYPELFSRTIGTSYSLEESWKEAFELYHKELDAFSRWGSIPEIQSYIEEEKGRMPTLSKSTYLAYEQYRYWDLVVERYRHQKKQEKFGSNAFLLHDSRFFFYDGFVMEQIGLPRIEMKDGKVQKRRAPVRRLYTFEQLQMIQDSCLARFNAFLAINNQMHNSPQDIESLLIRLLKWQESVLTKYGNLGYELVKGPESVAKSYLTKITNGDVMDIGSFERTVNKLKVKERKLSEKLRTAPVSKREAFKTPLTDELAEIIVDSSDIWSCAELFGCTKLSGHPFVYAEVSAESVRSEGCPQANYDLLAITEHHRHFMHIVLDRYLSKHKAWPPFSKNQHPKEGTRLRHLYDHDVKHVPKGSYPLSDWDDVEFGKFMEFDYSPDYLDMIDDKAICPGASKSAGFWYQSEPGSYRRLLEALIKKKDIDTVAIVDRMRKGQFFAEERIIELTQKEREFKTSARCFCKLVFEVRIFFVLTESNLKRFMGGDTGDNGYMPQQTMTMSNAKLRKRLYDLTANKKRNNTCLVEVDFTRWNLRWRAASVNRISRSLEKIFGLTGVFSQAHKFFASSTVVLTDKHSCPTGVKPGVPAHLWPESDLVWRNHIGGFEGIQQTLWTVCTIAMMYYALSDENCSFQMAGQGDNQVFYVSFDLTNISLKKALHKFLTNMERKCERLNHEVKPEECVDSTTVLTYGKEIYVNGVHVLYSLKFSSRAFARLDNSIPSLSKEIAGVVSNSVAVSGTLRNTFRAVWWKFIQVLLLLRRRLNSPIYSAEKPAIKRLLESRTSRETLLIPGSLGGLPMMPWTRYFSKGETDDVSFDVAATYYLSKSVPLIRSYMSLLIQGEFTPREVDKTNLINDPHSIPIERPNDATHLVADIVGKELPKIVVNTDLKPLVQPSLKNKGESFKSELLKMRPLYPEIASDLFALTPAGLYQKTVKRFSMTRTIEKIVPGTDVSSEILAANCLQLKVLLSRVAGSSRAVGYAHPPPYESAERLRDLWGVELKNSSVGIYTPFDFELCRFSPRFPTISAQVKYGTDLLDTYGNCPPNFGTKTKQKTSDHGYRIVNCNSTMRDLKQAALIYSELQAEPSTRPFIEAIINARSPWNLTQLVPLFPTVYGGTAVHRHAASRHSFAMLGSCSISTHVTLSSDNAGILSGGEDDYPVIFQTMFLTLTNLYQLIASAKLTTPSSIALRIPKELDGIDARPVVVSSEMSVPTWPPLRGNRLAWVQEMFASEVPTIPDPDLIPRIYDVEDDVDLIYSYLESEIAPNISSIKIWDGITQPRDIFDFKEISRVSPYDVEQALCWCAITEVFNEVLSYDVDNSITGQLSSILKRVVTILSGMWVRIRLHPMFSETDYNLRRHINLQPGSGGYKRPVEYMSSFLRREIKTILENKTTISIPRLVLFANWKETTQTTASRRLVLLHILALYPMVDIASLKECVQLSKPPNILLQRDPASYLHVSTRTISRKVRHLDYQLPSSECRFLNMSSQEAMRLLRKRQTADNVKISKRTNFKITNHGYSKWKVVDLHGVMKPSPSNIHLTDNTRYRTLARRTVGNYTPLYSDWNVVLRTSLQKNKISSITSHLFGVGRGATARVMCELKIPCVGYDLLSSFPDLAHRSAGYKPPELQYTDNSALFNWSSHTFAEDGDVSKNELDISDAPYDEVLFVVDLDMPYTFVLSLMSRLPLGAKGYVRLKGSEREIRYCLSVLKPNEVTSLVIDDGEIRDAVFYISFLSTVGDGNYETVEFTKKQEINYTYDQHDTIMQLWNVYPELSRYLEIRGNDSLDVIKGKLEDIQKSSPSTDEILNEARLITLGARPKNLSSGRYMRIKVVLDRIMK